MYDYVVGSWIHYFRQNFFRFFCAQKHERLSPTYRQRRVTLTEKKRRSLQKSSRIPTVVLQADKCNFLIIHTIIIGSLFLFRVILESFLESKKKINGARTVG